DICLPSGNSIFLELRRKLPSFAGEPVTLILVPAGSESRFQPRRASTLGEPPSTAQCSTVPSGLVTSMCSQEWGLTHSILTTFPSRTTVLDPSNSAEKEWCAVNGIVAASNRPTLATRLSLLRIGLLLNVRIYLLPKSYYESLTVTVSSCFRSSPDKEAYPQTVRTYVPGSARYYQPTDIAASRSSMALCTSRDRRASPRTGCESSRSTGIAQSPSICCCENCRHDPASYRRSYPSLRRQERRPPNVHWNGPSRNREDRARDPSCERTCSPQRMDKPSRYRRRPEKSGTEGCDKCSAEYRACSTSPRCPKPATWLGFRSVV